MLGPVRALAPLYDDAHAAPGVVCGRSDALGQHFERGRVEDRVERRRVGRRALVVLLRPRERLVGVAVGARLEVQVGLWEGEGGAKSGRRGAQWREEKGGSGARRLGDPRRGSGWGGGGGAQR